LREALCGEIFGPPTRPRFQQVYGMPVLQFRPTLSTFSRVLLKMPTKLTFHHRWNEQAYSAFHERRREQQESFGVETKSIPHKRLGIDEKSGWNVSH